MTKLTISLFFRVLMVMGMTPMDVVEKIGNPCNIETPAPVEARRAVPSQSITPGCIQRMYHLEEGKEHALGVVVQVLEVKKDPSGYRCHAKLRPCARCPHSPLLFVDRRLTLSDGEHWHLAWLDPALNDTVDIENLKPNTLVRLDEVICYIVGGCR